MAIDPGNIASDFSSLLEKVENFYSGLKETDKKEALDFFSKGEIKKHCELSSLAYHNEKAKNFHTLKVTNLRREIAKILAESEALKKKIEDLEKEKLEKEKINPSDKTIPDIQVVIDLTKDKINANSEKILICDKELQNEERHLRDSELSAKDYRNHKLTLCNVYMGKLKNKFGDALTEDIKENIKLKVSQPKVL